MRGTAGRWAIAIVLVATGAGRVLATPVATLPEREACAALPSNAVPADAARPARLRLQLAWRDLSGSIGPVAAQVRQEVARVFDPVDVAVEWRIASPEEPARDDEVSVIVLPRPRGALPAHVMGAVNRETKREAWIFVSGIERLLGARARERGPVPVDPEDLARLTGRVVAHELVHIIAPRLGHTMRGLMRAQWSRSLALQPALDLDTSAARAFLTALDPATALCPPPATTAPGEESADAVVGDPVDLL